MSEIAVPIEVKGFQWDGSVHLWEKLGHPFEEGSHPYPRWAVSEPRVNQKELRLWPGPGFANSVTLTAKVGDWVLTFPNGHRTVVTDAFYKEMTGG